jgi:hypothetical protein
VTDPEDRTLITPADLQILLDGWEAVEDFGSGELPEESDDCCDDMDDAHDHGYQRGYRDGMAYAADLLSGRASP